MISSDLPSLTACRIQRALQREIPEPLLGMVEVRYTILTLFKEGLFALVAGIGVSRQLPAFGYFRVCLTGRESLQPKSCPS